MLVIYVENNDLLQISIYVPAQGCILPLKDKQQ